MATLLHVFAHPRPATSQTLRIANAFIETYREAHPEDKIETLDLYRANVPHLTAAHLDAIAQQTKPEGMASEVAAAWQDFMTRVDQFRAADKLLVSTPMWNFGVPSVLKAYVDHVMLAGYTFRYTGPGAAVGAMAGHPAAIISTRGGIYSQPPMNEIEMCVNYLRNVFDFLGFDPVSDIVAEGIALVGPHEAEKVLCPAVERARELAKSF